MKSLVAIALSLALFASTRNEDLKVVLEKTYLTEQASPILNMIAAEIVAEHKLSVQPSVLVEAFREQFSAMTVELSKPYQGRFSDAEVKELRRIHENPVWQKYSKEGMTIVAAQVQVMRGAFQQLAVRFRAPLAEIWQITEDDFSRVEKANLPVIVDINASWCSACKSMAPIFDAAAQQYEGQIQFAKIDADSQQHLVKKFKVTGLPTLLFFKPGKKDPVMRSAGALDADQLDAKIQQLLKS
jgi:thioredoxin